MRVLHIVTGLSTGGAETMLLRLIERLHGEEFNQHVISLTNRGPIGESIASLGVPVETLSLSRRFPNPLALPKLARRIAHLCPTVVQTWMYHADLLGGLATRLAGIRALAWNIRNNNLSPVKTPRGTRGVVALCARASRYVPTRIVSCSQVAVATHVARGYDPERFLVIPNGFDLGRFSPDQSARRSVRTELNVPENAPLVGLIARFDPQKNHAMFFAAAALLHRRRPDIHFLLAGRGIEFTNPEIASCIHEAGISDVTHLLGERRDIPRLTASLDIATSSSSWGEAFPNVLGEAMACGVPCVTTDAGDAAFIVGDTGRIVSRGAPEALACAWDEILSMPQDQRRALGYRARARIAENFEIGMVAERYAALYRELAAGER